MWGTWSGGSTLRRRHPRSPRTRSGIDRTSQGFGYTISGTTQDGPHFHSGIDGFNYTDPTGVLGCTNCQVLTAGTGQYGRGA
jgi:type IV pilus assembly protein PilY1